MPMAGDSQGSLPTQHRFRIKCHKRGDRQASPTAANIDSQGVKNAEKSCLLTVAIKEQVPQWAGECSASRSACVKAVFPPMFAAIAARKTTKV
jgi:hypothetical protein